MIVPIVGMHRSGTSTVAGLLHQSGIAMGEEEALLPRPLPENPRGFYENVRFRILNDRMAERRGYRVDSWRTEIPACRPGAITRLRMRRLLRSYCDRYSVWGFKDPRSCLTLDSWLQEMQHIGVLDGVRVVLVVRDPDAVARSLAKRNGLEHSAALRLWKVYNERALAVLDAWAPATHTLRYEDLLANPETVSRELGRFVGLPPERVATDFVSAALDRSSRRARKTPPADDLASAVLQTNERILDRVRASRRADDGYLQSPPPRSSTGSQS